MILYFLCCKKNDYEVDKYCFLFFVYYVFVNVDYMLLYNNLN